MGDQHTRETHIREMKEKFPELWICIGYFSGFVGGNVENPILGYSNIKDGGTYFIDGQLGSVELTIKSFKRGKKRIKAISDEEMEKFIEDFSGLWLCIKRLSSFIGGSKERPSFSIVTNESNRSVTYIIESVPATVIIKFKHDVDFTEQLTPDNQN